MSTAQPDNSTRRYLVVAIKLAVSLALLWLLFSRIDIGKLWTTARTASVPWLLAAFAIYGIVVAASVWRWHLLLNAQGVEVPARRLTALVPGRAVLQ